MAKEPKVKEVEKENIVKGVKVEKNDYVVLSDAEVEAYYKDPAHGAQFQAPEEAQVEYVVLDLDAVKKGIAVSEDDLRKYYAENEKRYTAPEERRASHILVQCEKDAKEDVVKTKREQANKGIEAVNKALTGDRMVLWDRDRWGGRFLWAPGAFVSLGNGLIQDRMATLVGSAGPGSTSWSPAPVDCSTSSSGARATSWRRRRCRG